MQRERSRYIFMPKIFFLLVSLCAILPLRAQNELLSNFSASVVPDGVFIEWTIIAGTTCLGVIIERSEDGLQFSQIEHIEEVCGNVVEPVSYSFLDPDPIHGEVSFYRLILGLDGTTEPISITYYQVDGSGFSVAVNSGLNELQVYTIQPHSEPYTVDLYDVQGKAVGTAVMADESSILDISGLNRGIFFLQVKSSARLLFTKKLLL